MSEYSMPSYFQSMPVIGKDLSAFHEDNAAEIQAVEQEIHEIREAALEAGKSTEALNESGQWTAMQRIMELVDEGTWCPLNSLYNPQDNKNGSVGIVKGLGRIDGKWAVIIASDNKKLAGAWVPGNWNFRCVRLWYRGRYFNADDCRNPYVGLQENIELGGQNMSSYIEVRNVSKSFSGRAILQNISLSVEQGTTVGLVGANGSGKSVLFKIICGFEKPDQGSVYVRGNQLGKNGCDFPESLGVFINSPGFIGIYSGFQNLKFLADIQGKIGEKEIRQTMTKVGLDPDNKAKVDNYSLGMKQKLGLAQAIMEGQDILILDEPFNALDYKTYEDVKAIIRMLKAEGKTIFLTSHHYKDIEQLCDQVYSLEDCQLLPITEEIAARYREMD